MRFQTQWTESDKKPKIAGRDRKEEAINKQKRIAVGSLAEQLEKSREEVLTEIFDQLQHQVSFVNDRKNACFFSKNLALLVKP